MSQTYQVRRGTAAEWTSANPTLPSGVIGLETDTTKWKIGTGAAAWTALNYVGGSAYTPGLKTAVTTNVLSSAAASVTLTLPSGYKGFRIEAKLRGDAATSAVDGQLRLNGDASAVYQYQRISAQGATSAAAEVATPGTSIRVFPVPGATATANYYGHVVVDIPFPDMTTGWKDVLVRTAGAWDTTTGIWLDHSWGIRRSTAAITSASFTASSGNFLAGSTFKVMGFK